MRKAFQFRKHARDCRELEKAAQSPEERALLRDLALHWDAIADIHERLAEAHAVRGRRTTAVPR
jgi:hypothetical protein